MHFSVSCLVPLVLFLNHLSAAHTKMSDSNMKLEMVQVLFRHGERTPLKHEYSVFNHTDISVYEPFGLEQLTNNGKMQAYQVGQMLRERYNDFLNETYSSQHVNARSSGNARTKMTLQLVLAGLFPPSDGLKWNSGLDWMPIDYNYVPQELDALLKSQATAKYDLLYQDALKTPAGIKMLASYKDIFYFFNRVGIKSSPDDLVPVVAVYNILLIKERMKLPLPEWYTDEIKIRLKQAFEDFHDYQSYTQEMKRLNGGPIIKTFISNMNLDESVVNPKKLYLYSAHDMNLAAVIRALNIQSSEEVDFCSTLVLEKLRDSKNKAHVRLLHWNGVKKELKVVRIGNCGDICPINDFLEVSRCVIPTDEELFSLYDGYDINYMKQFFPQWSASS